MKKILVLLFFSTPLYAGRIFVEDPDPWQKINEYKISLFKIRTQLGYDLPPGETVEILTLHQRLLLIKKFENLWHDYKTCRAILKNNFDKTREGRIFFAVFTVEIVRDKNRYATLVAREIIDARRQNQLVGI